MNVLVEALRFVLKLLLPCLRFLVTRRGICLLVAAAVIVPFLYTLPLPFEPSPWAKAVYNTLDKLPPGSHVLLSFDYGPGSKEEIYPMSLAILRHCHKKGLVPVVMTHVVSNVDLSRKACEQAAADAKEMWGKEVRSGRDYVYLGFKPGYSNLVLNMGESIKGAFPKDYYGQPTQTMKALEGVDSLKDIDMGMSLASIGSIEMWIAFGADRSGFPFAAGCTAVMTADMYPYLQSKQMVGFLSGLRGAADYEQLVGVPGDATRGMQSQSVTHVLLIILILGANVVFIAGRIRSRRAA